MKDLARIKRINMKENLQDFYLVPIAQYASIHGLNPATVRQKCIRGGWQTAIKIGRDWFINPDEPHTDLRRKGKV